MRLGLEWWRVKDLNLRRQSRGIYSPLPLAARATRQGQSVAALWYYERKGYLSPVRMKNRLLFNE